MIPDKYALIKFYSDHFRTDQLERVISRDNLHTREFAFKYTADDDSVDRPENFNSLDSFSDYLGTYGPNKVYVGGFYERRFPEDKNLQARVRATEWKGRELAYDIDMDHYINARKGLCDCGTEKVVCDICIDLAKEAVEFLIETLVNDFGMPREDIVVVFSGRQGFHVWVPSRTRFFDNLYGLTPREAARREADIRQALGEYVNLVSEKKRTRLMDGDKETEYVVSLNYDTLPHPLMRRVLDMVFKNFVLKSPPDTLKEIKGIRQERWQRIKEELAKGECGFNTYTKFIGSRETKGREKKIYEQFLKTRFPRYDVGCTKDIHRIMKVPGSVDGSTGNLCVIVEDLDSFTLSDVPHISDF